MWTMWFVYYANEHNWFTMYPNLPGKTALAANWREAGVHYSEDTDGKKSPSTGSPDSALYEAAPGDEFRFPDDPLRLDWDGTKIVP